MKSEISYETDEDVDYEYWLSKHNAYATLSISYCLHNKSMNLIHLPEKYHISILDGKADTLDLDELLKCTYFKCSKVLLSPS
jgi:hypothetical protein